LKVDGKRFNVSCDSDLNKIKHNSYHKTNPHKALNFNYFYGIIERELSEKKLIHTFLQGDSYLPATLVIYSNT